MDQGTESLIGSLLELSSLKNLEIVKGKEEKEFIIAGELNLDKHCSSCGSCKLRKRGKKTRSLRLPPCGDKKLTLNVLQSRQSCNTCGKLWFTKLPFAEGRQRMTKSFVTYALELLRFATIQDVAKHLGTSWDLIKDLHKQKLSKSYEAVDMSEVRFVSIDEFSIAKGHKYMSVILDNKTGRILDSVVGRKVEDVADMLQNLKKKHQDLKLSQWI